MQPITHYQRLVNDVTNDQVCNVISFGALSLTTGRKDRCWRRHCQAVVSDVARQTTPSCRVEVVDPVRPNILGERVRRAPRKTSIQMPSQMSYFAPGAIHQSRISRRASTKVKLESSVSSGHTEEPEPIGETSTTGTRQRVRMLHGPISDCIISDIN